MSVSGDDEGRAEGGGLALSGRGQRVARQFAGLARAYGRRRLEERLGARPAPKTPPKPATPAGEERGS